MSYIRCEDIINHLDIKKDDTILVSSDVSRLAMEANINGDRFDSFLFIGSLIERIGENGTLLFPTYNWDFCKGVAFDYYKTPCRTGALARAALKMKTFRRTRHPIYSFAVWGRDQDILCSLKNKSSFGPDSPFAYLHKKNAKNLVIDSELRYNFTFVHYVEEMTGNLEYRYLKDFHGGYTDEDGAMTSRVYSMFVRNLDLDVVNTINPLEPLFMEAGYEKQLMINSVSYKIITLGDVYSIIENDILNNRSRLICTYAKQ